MPKRPTAAGELLNEALSLDARGHEREAVPLYRRAIAGGLSGDALHTALVCLGSSLRTIGQLDASVRTLQKALRLFPRDPAVMMFLALAHYDRGQHELAVRQLADVLLKESTHPRLAPYRKVLSRKYHAIRGKRRR